MLEFLAQHIRARSAEGAIGHAKHIGCRRAVCCWGGRECDCDDQSFEHDVTPAAMVNSHRARRGRRTLMHARLVVALIRENGAARTYSPMAASAHPKATYQTGRHCKPYSLGRLRP